MPMRIAHVITGLAADGAETMLYKLLGSMDRRRFDPLVVSLTRGGALAPSIAALGIPVLEPSPSSFRKIQTFRPDILQGWMYHGNLAAQAMAKRCRKSFAPVRAKTESAHGDHANG